jgi:hypothetical protein
VRNRIYDFVFGECVQLKVSPIHERLKKQPRYPYSIGLLYACRQIYTEASFLPYKLPTFLISDTNEKASFCSWLRQRTVAQREAIRAIEFTCYTSDVCLELIGIPRGYYLNIPPPPTWSDDLQIDVRVLSGLRQVGLLVYVNKLRCGVDYLHLLSVRGEELKETVERKCEGMTASVEIWDYRSQTCMWKS